MQVHSSFPAGVLITNGLGANASSGALITAAKWNLFGCDATITIQTTSSGGGSRPFAPGEIQNFYKPVALNDVTEPFYIPTNIESKQKNVVIVKIKIGNIENEKEFILNKKPFNMAVKILNVMNISDNIIKVSLNSISTKISNIKIMIKNIITK